MPTGASLPLAGCGAFPQGNAPRVEHWRVCAVLVIDFHLDLAMNALNWDRDLNLSAHEMRELERGMTQKGRARGNVGFPDMRRGRVALSSATVIASWQALGSNATGSRTQEISYGKAQGQLAYYRLLERRGVVRIVEDAATLKSHIAEWRAWEDRGAPEPTPPLGFVISMEGADPIDR